MPLPISLVNYGAFTKTIPRLPKYTANGTKEKKIIYFLSFLLSKDCRREIFPENKGKYG